MAVASDANDKMADGERLSLLSMLEPLSPAKSFFCVFIALLILFFVFLLCDTSAAWQHG